jgi:hypothetical protein
VSDGRYIDPTIGTLSGEASEQRVQEKEKRLDEMAVEAWKTVPSQRDLTTYYDRPVIKPPVWKWYIPAYFVSGGAAGAAATLGAVAQLFGGEALRPLVRHCRLLALAGTTIGTGFLVADLGVKSKFLNMLRMFRPTSPMSVGSWILAPSTGAAAASVVLPGPLGDLAGLGAGALGPGLAGYTAILTSNTSVPIWAASRKALPAMYVSSAASTAASLLALTSLDGASERTVHLLDVAASIGELASGAWLDKEADAVHEVGKPLHEGTSGDLWKVSKILTAIGLVLSLLRGRRTRQAGAFLGLLGSVAAKFAIFRAGIASSHDPRATFAQQRAGTR